MFSNVNTDSKPSISQQFCESNQLDVNSDTKIHFIHIKQLHAPNLPLLQAMFKNEYKVTFPIELLKRATVDSYERAARSQLKVAQAILEHPNCPVLDENLDCDITFDTIREHKKEEKYLEETLKYEKLFPGGKLPEFEELNDSQKEVLCEYGAPQILHLLKKITAIYKSVHPEVYENFVKLAMSGDVKDVCDTKINSAREQEALACAREAAIKHNHSTVLVVYGAGHNFKIQSKAAGFSYGKIDCASNYSIFNSLKNDRVLVENLRSLVCIPNDIGYGNTMGIRSEPSWDTTVPFTWTPEGWIGKLPNDGKRFKFVVISQEGAVTWEKIQLPPTYCSIFYRNITLNGNRILYSRDFPQEVIGSVKF
jgi:hypothetical protein